MRQFCVTRREERPEYENLSEQRVECKQLRSLAEDRLCASHPIDLCPCLRVTQNHRSSTRQSPCLRSLPYPLCSTLSIRCATPYTADSEMHRYRIAHSGATLLHWRINKTRIGPKYRNADSFLNEGDADLESGQSSPLLINTVRRSCTVHQGSHQTRSFPKRG